MFWRSIGLPLAALLVATSGRSDSDGARERDAAVLTARVVDDASGRPIAGARVTVVWDFASPHLRVEATTSADGAVLLTLDPWHGSAVRWDVFHPDHVRASGFGVPVSGVLGEVRQPPRFELGELSLERGVAISGRVVSAGERRPVAGGEVRLLSLPAGGDYLGPGVAGRLATTDHAGGFVLSERVGSQRGAPVTLFAVADGGIGWKSVVLDAARPQVDDVVIELESDHSLAARVVDHDGRPIEGATVVALPRFAPLGAAEGDLAWWIHCDDLAIYDRFVATTGGDGAVEFRRLPAPPGGATYELHAQAHGHDPAQAPPLEVPRQAPGPVTIVLQKWKETKEWRPIGAVRDPRGRPIEGAVVEYRHDKMRTGADGRFEWLYRLSLEGSADAIEDELMRASAPGHGRAWRRLPAELEGDVVLDFVLADPVPITGRVIDEGGAPVADVVLELTRAGDSEAITGCDELTAKSDGDGRFAFDETWEGEWWLDVSPFFGRHDHDIPDRLRVAAGEEVVVRVNRSRRGEATLVATVVAGATGAPVEVDHAQIELERSASWWTSFHPTVESSRVVQEKLLPGRYVLRVRTRDGRHGAARFAIDEGDTTVPLTLALDEPCEIEGRVVPSRGERARVHLHPPLGHGDPITTVGSDVAISFTSTHDGEAELDDTGRFRFHGVAPGIPLDIAFAGDGRVATQRVTLAPGETRAVELQPVAAGELAIVGAEGLADGIVRLDIADAAEFERDSAATSQSPWAPGSPWRFVRDDFVGDARDLLGTTRPSPLAPGRWRWRASYWPLPHDGPRDEPRIVEGDIEIVAGGRASIDLSSLR